MARKSKSSYKSAVSSARKAAKAYKSAKSSSAKKKILSNARSTLMSHSDNGDSKDKSINGGSESSSASSTPSKKSLSASDITSAKKTYQTLLDRGMSESAARNKITSVL